MGKTTIIWEAGINHNGNLGSCLKMIDIAVDCGCDIFKLQKRDINSTYTKEELDKSRESPWGTTTRQQKEGLEFNEEAYDHIFQYCKDKGIDLMVSPWDMKSVAFLKKYDLKYNKIPSARLGHLELLEAIAKEGKYTFISTGMAEIEEIGTAINIFKKYDCSFELMYCNSQYPLADENANLLAMRRLHHIFDCKVGYSDHTPGLIASIVAVALGASSIEKHGTLNRTDYGSDQAASVEPNGFHKLVEWIRAAESVMGEGTKKISEPELSIRKKLWRIKDVINGE